ncbi:MAG: cryptochrome/photolyase family protein [Gammaproteobacteria bacterium]
MNTAIVWFRRDLRIEANPALLEACAHERLVPVYIHDPESEGTGAPGEASRWWLHHALRDLDAQLRARGSQLLVFEADSGVTLETLADATNADAVYWNRSYEPDLIKRDGAIKKRLRQRGLDARSFNAGLLYEPWGVQNKQGLPFRVFTPFWKHCLTLPRIAAPEPLPDKLPPLHGQIGAGTLDGHRPDIDALELLPRIPWDRGFYDHWSPTRGGVLDRLQDFLDGPVGKYPNTRDTPAIDGVSRLSPWLHFGQIGPAEIAQHLDRVPGKGADAWYRQLVWREFAHHLLFHFPDTVREPMNPAFAAMPWRHDTDTLEAWQQGRTGIPLVDAGMRELWHTGWMHNRVRMVVASLLTKNQLLHWHHGADWFMDTLVDADLANNTMGWQWVAGSGADAAPYFRIFNPVSQGERFDPDGAYVRHWVPELAKLPNSHIHKPWEADDGALRDVGLRLGRDYPRPIVDLKKSRQRALDAYEHVKAAKESPGS